MRIQFHWQRGSRAAARLSHPEGTDNAPASDTLGTWVRIATPVAGANWGGHWVPRPGQEVLVTFIQGNVDRPAVIGAVFNGEGEADAAGNRHARGASEASANAPAFFAGAADPHAHHAAMSGIKTQSLNTSRTGHGGFNQLIFDDAPYQSRLEFGSTQYKSWLQLGYLKQQQDNARLADRGHGAEMTTQAAMGLRAGSGLLVSANARGNAVGHQLDSRESIEQTRSAEQLVTRLADLAVKQHAVLKGDVEVQNISPHKGLAHALEVLGSTQSQDDQGVAEHGEFKAVSGGFGVIPAWCEARVEYAAPGGIAQLTPANVVLAAGKSLCITTHHDTHLVSQANQSVSLRGGLALFTVGKAETSAKPNAETGIHLHAASGQVSLQSQSDETRIAADSKVTLASTHQSVNASAKSKLLATAQGAYLKIDGDNIELHAPGQVQFKASHKILTGPANAAGTRLQMPQAPVLYDEVFVVRDKISGQSKAFVPYRIEDSAGSVLTRGVTDHEGRTLRVQTGAIKSRSRLIVED